MGIRANDKPLNVLKAGACGLPASYNLDFTGQKNMYCTQYALVNGKIEQPEATVLKCKCWDCDRCEPGRRKAVFELALAGKPNKFLTLTVNPSVGVDADERAQSLLWAWRILVKRLQRRHHIKRIEYLWIVEATKNNEPHIHILLRAPWIDKQYISDVMKELINAPIVDIQAVSNQRSMAYYVSKYCSKDARKFAGCKRYGYTGGWIVDEDYRNEKEGFKSGEWSRYNKSIREIADIWVSRGYDIEWLEADALIAHKTIYSRETKDYAGDMLPQVIPKEKDYNHKKLSDVFEESYDAGLPLSVSSWWMIQNGNDNPKKLGYEYLRRKFIPPASFARAVPLRNVYKRHKKEEGKKR